MPIQVIDASALQGDRRCLNVRGVPLCAPPGTVVPGALVVERLVHVTCPVCIAITNVPPRQLTRPGVA